jgi:uncharacterized repeat protein (TIGR03803 family)
MHTRSLGGLASAFVLILLGAVPPATAQTEVVLYNFCSQPGCIDGAGPMSNLLPDGAGDFYGTTQLGGANNSGTIFELSPDGSGGYNETVLYSFCSLANCSDGTGPTSNLIFDPAGNLYGTTSYGGQSASGPVSGYGVVFELSPAQSGCPAASNAGNGWCETVLHSFLSNPDGALPFAALIQDASGNLYGTTYAGGSGMGTAYELSPTGPGTWSETVLYDFCSQSGCPDGANPNGLVEATNGTIVSTTQSGGVYSAGTAFALSAQPAGGCPSGDYTGNGWCESILHVFAGFPTDGGTPSGAPVIDSGGNIFGTTVYGGRGTCKVGQGCGSIWKLSPGSAGQYSEEIIHSFHSGPGTLGCCYPIRLSHYPWAGVTIDASGNIYSTTVYGGSSSYCTQKHASYDQGCGTLFELTIRPSLTHISYEVQVPWVFGWTDGANPLSSLTLDGGNLYGTSYSGGPGSFCLNPSGCGLAFEFTP